MNIGDRVKFTKAGKHFNQECDIGVIVGMNSNRDRPYRVRWDHGVETNPVADFLTPVETPRRHKWDAEGERCVYCGDKDWMESECSGAPQP